jgi:hypothetical protein
MKNKKSIETRAREFYIETKLADLKAVRLSDEKDLKKNQLIRTSKPYADIVYKNGSGGLRYVEIKATAAAKVCFGAITQSEVEKARVAGKNYVFQLIVEDKETGTFTIGPRYTLQELIDCKLITIPPVKYYFNLDVKKKITESVRRNATTLVATMSSIISYSKLRKKLL